ncbi:hypothetical protein SAMN04488104_10677 [Algoriphagus faecimaris]|uniref:Uncharacterized protein n=1 Tax=Algoriphagus faecimaris TaxID=686796 RepID=A0A1G6XUP3_9BACT|nr:hypothetical protein [Algoriphagus faecimaris]SDD81423.1 hypothetical protein SAMN04488104_10677 [Algoriphagus faecimaris]
MPARTCSPWRMETIIDELRGSAMEFWEGIVKGSGFKVPATAKKYWGAEELIGSLEEWKFGR